MVTLITRIWALSLLISSGWLYADIAWEKTEVEITPKEGETQVEVPFLFSVEQGGAVQILDVGSSCGCTVPTLQKRLYSPGESGVLEVVFTPGTRQGRQVKQVIIKTVEAGKETETKLTLVVNLPEWAKPEASRLKWRSPDASLKSLKIATAAGTTLSLIHAGSLTAERFSVELMPDALGRSYILKATPLASKRTGLTPVFVDVFQGQLRVSSLTLFLVVD